ncbi:snRNA-activating protein complex subunit 5 [Mustelus asterias]
MQTLRQRMNEHRSTITRQDCSLPVGEHFSGHRHSASDIRMLVGSNQGFRMLSRLQELKKEEEALLKIKTSLQDQLNRLKVEELALRSMINNRQDGDDDDSDGCGQAPEPVESSMQVDDASVINQTQLQLTTLQTVRNVRQRDEEEEEEEDDVINS